MGGGREWYVTGFVLEISGNGDQIESSPESKMHLKFSSHCSCAEHVQVPCRDRISVSYPLHST